MVALLSPCWLGDLSSPPRSLPPPPLLGFSPSGCLGRLPSLVGGRWWGGHPSCPLPFRLGGLHLPFSRRSPPSLFVETVSLSPSWLGRLPSLVFWWSNFLSLLVGRSLFVFLVGTSPFSLFVGKKKRKEKKKRKKRKQEKFQKQEKEKEKEEKTNNRQKKNREKKEKNREIMKENIEQTKEEKKKKSKKVIIKGRRYCEL